MKMDMRLGTWNVRSVYIRRDLREIGWGDVDWM
jgi:hypothetical protein